MIAFLPSSKKRSKTNIYGVFAPVVYIVAPSCCVMSRENAMGKQIGFVAPKFELSRHFRLQCRHLLSCGGGPLGLAGLLIPRYISGGRTQPSALYRSITAAAPAALSTFAGVWGQACSGCQGSPCSRRERGAWGRSDLPWKDMVRTDIRILYVKARHVRLQVCIGT